MKSITLSAMNLFCGWVLLAGTAHGVGADTKMGGYAATGGDVLSIYTNFPGTSSQIVYGVHSFTNVGSATFKPNWDMTAEYLVIGGGGGGGSGGLADGGGGAGGYRSSVANQLSGGNTVAEAPLRLCAYTAYLVNVGAGGAAGNNGKDSVFHTVTALGGGYGGSGNSSGNTGGSGGGAGTSGASSQVGSAGTAGQGMGGGTAWRGGDDNGGGGGGAGEVGSNNRNGGAGISNSITGAFVTRAGGGGGGDYNGVVAAGGAGGGAGGAAGAGTPGTDTFGGGGGGGGRGNAGAAGGSGIVIVRYKLLGIYNRTASNVSSNKATFNAWLVSAGIPPSAVNVLWGENNGAERGVWAHTNVWKPGAWKENSYPSLEMAKLTPDRTYYYAFGLLDAKTNEVADHPVSFITGALAVRVTKRESTEDAPAEFVITRPATASSAALEVNFTLAGIGVNGTDYEQLDSPVVIPASKTEVRLRVTPKFNFGDQRPKSVELSLVPGGYVVGAKRNATILTRAE
ncbi:MAG: glycine-rich domain-containing protein [Kiritimatiellia bacterium]